MQNIDEDEKQAAQIRLLAELGKGVESLRREGALSVDEAFRDAES